MISCTRCGKTDNSSEDEIIFHFPFDDNSVILCDSCYKRLHLDFKPSRYNGIKKVEEGTKLILEGLHDEFGLNLDDPNLKDTPKRVARSYYEMCCGINCQEDIDCILDTKFPTDYHGIVVSKGIECYSLCPHHLSLVIYNIDIGYIPGQYTIGLSKIPRIVKLLAKAPKLQEQLTDDIMNALVRIGCEGVIVQVRGQHSCMQARGVEQRNVETLTSAIYGSFEDPAIRSEFQMLSK